MADSFFEKLKKGMGIEIPIEEEVEEKPKKPIREKKLKKVELKSKPIEEKIEKVEKSEVKEGTDSVKIKEEKLSKVETLEGKEVSEDKEKWFEPEGQLAVDVYQTEEEIVIQSTIAGIKPEDLDITIENDVITIKGKRENPNKEEVKNYFYQECYWGPFSREIILPAEVDGSRAEATMKEGILTIRIPKIEREKKRKIMVKA